MARPSRFSPEVRERAVRMVFEHTQEHASQWAAITSIAEKIGCAAETLRSWVRQAERDGGQRPGLTTDERARFKAARTRERRVAAGGREPAGGPRGFCGGGGRPPGPREGGVLDGERGKGRGGADRA